MIVDGNGRQDGADATANGRLRRWTKVWGIAGLLFVVSGSVKTLEAAAAKDAITGLKCDGAETPLGSDDARPRFAWQMMSGRRGARQTAYEVTVAGDGASLQPGAADLWDSGKIASGSSVDVVYGGAALMSRHRYYWQVRTWTDAGVELDSPVSWWETGLMTTADWKAKWIAADSEVEAGNRAANPEWIGAIETKGKPRDPSTEFRVHFELKEQPVRAELMITAKDNVGAWLNGGEVLAKRVKNPSIDGAPWGTFQRVDVTKAVHAGENVLAAEATVERGNGARGGLLALLVMTMPDGSIVRVKSEPNWRSTTGAEGAWRESSFDDRGWLQSAVVGKVGDTHGYPWPLEDAMLYRKTFEAHSGVRSARLYATALGSYIPFLNGKRVGGDVLAPGWTDYRDVLTYQTYDVTAMVADGANALGVCLGDGWYASGMVNSQRRFAFGGPPLRFMAQLQIDYNDGSQQTIVSDESWVTKKSPILRSDIYNGEAYDARLEDAGWASTAGKADGWAAVTMGTAPAANVKLAAQSYPAIRVEMMLPPKSIKKTGAGIYLVDLGQNMVGTERITARGASGQTIKLQFGEVLNEDGTFYRENMRGAAEEDTFTLKGGGGQETFEPSFTYHGYRYIQISNYPGKLKAKDISGVVFHTDAAFTMSFHTMNKVIDKLVTNILWGQRGNFMSVPTDCPQRDERLGWTGDAAAFWRTASYNMELDSFSQKYARDLQIAQTADGEFTDIAPRVLDTAGQGTPGWADAGIVIPWTAYTQYGDVKILQDAWPSMKRYMDYLAKQYPLYISDHKGYGDWLAIGSKTPEDVIATAFWAYDAEMMSRIATALGDVAEASSYGELRKKIVAAFNEKFISSDGVVGSGSQTSDVLALRFGLVPEDMKAKVADALVSDIRAHQNHLTTGFLGTPFLLPVLTETGHADVAFDLLTQDSYPGWEYMVEHGATTMWERWNGNQMLADATMNSFNHYAYGAVGEWLYRYVAGIDLETKDAAFHTIELRPHFSEALGSVDASYESPYGAIKSAWKMNGHDIRWMVTVPANTTAIAHLSAGAVKSVDGGKNAGAGVCAVVEGESLCNLVAGTYVFKLNQ